MIPNDDVAVSTWDSKVIYLHEKNIYLFHYHVIVDNGQPITINPV